MTRLKLFFFYTAMAWASMLKPTEGQIMVADAEEGARTRQRRETIAHLHLNGGRARKPEGRRLMLLAAALAIGVTCAWVSTLVYLAAGALR